MSTTIDQDAVNIRERLKSLPRGSQSRVARMTGMPVSTVSEFKRHGGRRPSHHMIKTLGRAVLQVETEIVRERQRAEQEHKVTREMVEERIMENRLARTKDSHTKLKTG